MLIGRHKSGKSYENTIIFPDKVDDLHSHFESFKSTIETDFKHLKEATSQNVQNIQTSLNIQQTYSSTLCTHVNNIYNRLSELEKQIQHHCMYPHQTDTVQINAPEYNLDIDRDNQPNTHNSRVTVSVPSQNNHRASPSQRDPVASSRTSFRHNTFRKSLVTEYKPTPGYHRHFRNDSI